MDQHPTMNTALVPVIVPPLGGELILPGEGGGLALPRIIAAEGERAAKRFLEFFTANIRNKNTREAYARAVLQFLAWCEERSITLRQIEPMTVAAYIEQKSGQPQTVKQHLAAIR